MEQDTYLAGWPNVLPSRRLQHVLLLGKHRDVRKGGRPRPAQTAGPGTTCWPPARRSAPHQVPISSTVTRRHVLVFQPWALTNGGTLLSADWSKSTLASPQTIEAAAFAQSLCQKGYSPKPGGAFDDVAEFADDKLAIFGCGMWLNPGISPPRRPAK